MKRSRLMVAAALVATLSTAVVVGPAALSSAHQTPTTDTDFTNIPVHGHVQDGTGRTFSGNLDIRRFDNRNGGVVAIGRIDGVLKNSSGAIIRRIGDPVPVVIPVTEISAGGQTALAAAQAATCDVLHLELGPLDLDLLGLVIHLNKVVLDIDAQSGPGNLLGNLICAIAGLLDGTGFNLNAVLADLLNAIAGILRL